MSRIIRTDKTCWKCETLKPIEEFYANKSRGDGRSSACKNCSKSIAKERHDADRKTYNGHMKEWRLKNPDRQRRYRIKANYGLVQDDFNAMLDKQENRCAVCKSTDYGKGRNNWCIDHDHKTGEVRGLVCFYCNLLFGNCDDNPTILMNAIIYLSDPPFKQIKRLRSQVFDPSDTTCTGQPQLLSSLSRFAGVFHTNSP